MATHAEMPAAERVPVAGLAGYQEGKVISHALLKRAGGTLTLLAFDGGQALPEHTNPFDAVAHILEGDAEIHIAGKPVNAGAGDLVLMPANQPHAVSARTRVRMLLITLRSA